MAQASRPCTLRKGSFWATSEAGGEAAAAAPTAPEPAAVKAEPEGKERPKDKKGDKKEKDQCKDKKGDKKEKDHPKDKKGDKKEKEHSKKKRSDDKKGREKEDKPREPRRPEPRPDEGRVNKERSQEKVGVPKSGATGPTTTPGRTTRAEIRSSIPRRCGDEPRPLRKGAGLPRATPYNPYEGDEGPPGPWARQSGSKN